MDDKTVEIYPYCYKIKDNCPPCDNNNNNNSDNILINKKVVSDSLIGIVSTKQKG